MTGRNIFWIAISISLILAFILFFNLTDTGQFFAISNNTYVTSWLLRIPVAIISFFALVIAWLVQRKNRNIVTKNIFIVLCFVWLFFIFNGLLLNSYLLFKPLPNPADVTYLNVEDADALINENEDVVVLEVNGATAAYPKNQIRSPHIAGITIAGEDITVSYCGLSNVGIAFSPGSGKEHFDMGIIGQSNNNLVMIDKQTGEPVQQISGKYFKKDKLLDERSTFRMSYGNYKKAFPDGKIFRDSVDIPFYRKVISDVFFYIAGFFMEREDLAFPYKIHNKSLAGKELVYGLGINGDYVAYTEDYIKRTGGIINTEIGGEKIVLAHIEDYDTIAAFHADDEINQIDLFGNSNAGKLARVNSFRSKVYWGVWQHYFPGTALNR